MKTCNLVFLIGFTFYPVLAQETVTPASKKLQQLYLSLGAGPALNGKNDLHPHGSNFDFNFTATLSSDYLFRLGFKRNAFVGTFDPEPKLFGFLELNEYSYFIPSTHINSIQFAAGKRKIVNKFIQAQALTGLSFNQISQPDQYPTFALERSPAIWEYHLVRSNQPGAFAQAEIMFLPSRYAGLTLGAYGHYSSAFSNGGLTLSLNLGLLK